MEIPLMNSSNIHPIVPVRLQPTTQMTHWQIHQVTRRDGAVEQHLVGRADGEGRVSSTVLNVDAAQRRVTTRSGRVYWLAGDPGTDSDAQYVWNWWLDFHQAVAGGVVKLADLAALVNLGN
jgi:hypothetical protein